MDFETSPSAGAQADPVTTQWVTPQADSTASAARSRRPLGRYAVMAVVGLVAWGGVSNAMSPDAETAGTAPSAAPSVSMAEASQAVAPQTSTPTTTPAATPLFGPTGPTQLATVTRIVDGDTIRVQIEGVEFPVRYIGMDTPEPDAEDPTIRAFAEQATHANAALVEGRDVVLERDVSDADQFGRLLRHVWMTDGLPLLVNAELVRQGFAQVSTYPPDVKYVDRLLAAQDAAQASGANLWGPTPSATPSPTPSPTPTPLPTAAPTPSPAPTAAPVAMVDDTALRVTIGTRQRFEGRIGQYTWTDLRLAENQTTVRWSVSASSRGDCRVNWKLLPAAGDQVGTTIRAAAGDSETGNRRYTTRFRGAQLIVRSTCGTWKLSLQAYEPPPPAPLPIAGGGGSGGGGGNSSNCHPSYKGACLKRGAGDYDCAGGSGNGPNYVSGPVSVVGNDEFDLDRDNDGVGCE